MTDETAATNAAEGAIASESQVAESAPAGEESAAPAKDGFTKRIDELTKNWRDTERDRDDASRRADEAARDAQYWRDQALRAQQPQKPAAPAETAVKTLADFEYDDGKYQAYLFEQAESRAVKAAERRLREQSETDARDRRKSEFNKRETEFEKANPDYRSKTRSPSFPVSDAMAEVCQESDEGPAVLLYLANNIPLADQIARMQPLAAARELGRIEAKLIGAREAAAKTVSNAPPPPPKIEGSGDSGTTGIKPTDPDSDKLSDDEWLRRRNKQVARRS
jgi:hypothetical protein